MPCPDDLTPRQCKVRDALAHKLEQQGVKGNAWAIATAHVKQMKEARRGQ